MAQANGQSPDELSEVEQLRRRVEDLEGRLTGLSRQNDRLKTILAGSVDEFSTWDADQMTAIHERLEDIEGTVSDHAERFEMFVVENGKQATPDKRAMHLRQVLLNEAQSKDGVAKMRRESCGTTIGGGLHKGSVLDAMRRAANGSEARIDGKSDLEPVDAIEFQKGGTVGSDGQAEQSYVKLDTSGLTGTEARQILTTEEGAQGASE